jgi:NDP-sugar pyrophosphorylase family protein
MMNITGDFFVANADTWLATGIRELGRVVAPAIATVNVSDTSRYGAVVKNDGLVRAFREKSESSGPGDINAGLYRLSADQFAGDEIRVGSFEVDVFPALVSQGALRMTHLKTDFIDIGIPADYFRFCEWIGSGKASAL